MSPFMENLRERYLLRKGYSKDSLGFVAPEIGLSSTQVLTLAEVVEELQVRVDVLENLRKFDQDISKSVYKALTGDK